MGEAVVTEALSAAAQKQTLKLCSISHPSFLRCDVRLPLSIALRCDREGAYRGCGTITSSVCRSALWKQGDLSGWPSGRHAGAIDDDVLAGARGGAGGRW